MSRVSLEIQPFRELLHVVYEYAAVSDSHLPVLVIRTKGKKDIR